MNVSFLEHHMCQELQRSRQFFALCACPLEVGEGMAYRFLANDTTHKDWQHGSFRSHTDKNTSAIGP